VFYEEKKKKKKEIFLKSQTTLTTKRIHRKVMHSALLHHLLTNAQPVSEQWQPLPTPLLGSSPSFIVQHNAT